MKASESARPRASEVCTADAERAPLPSSQSRRYTRRVVVLWRAHTLPRARDAALRCRPAARRESESAWTHTHSERVPQIYTCARAL